MTEGIDHLGIATHSLDSHTNFWLALGFEQGVDEINEEPVSYTHLTLPTKA